MKRKSPPSERDYQKAAIEEWAALGGFAQNIHPTIGMKLGIPDAEFLVGPFLVPIEFKVGEAAETRSNKLHIAVKRIRPSQRKWHLGYRRSGGVSGIIVGTPIGIFAPSIDQFISGSQKFDAETLERFATYSEAVEFISRPLTRLLQ